eukprot:TRINITY_DN103475_c0_g1_i1.p1 TRINITY_DN103475_c0_g1~~TRINITY_DN103475_c0_g1_i1.p1  ORF type:complete len:120 (-),score=2.05 TRINITY_DN103475_c0_g1_i1:182-541(-)
MSSVSGDNPRMFFSACRLIVASFACAVAGMLSSHTHYVCGFACLQVATQRCQTQFKSQRTSVKREKDGCLVGSSLRNIVTRSLALTFTLPQLCKDALLQRWHSRMLLNSDLCAFLGTRV